MVSNRISHRGEESKIRKVCNILETISHMYPDDSPEYKALEEGVLAYIWVNLRKDLKEPYSNYRKAFTHHKSLATQLTLAETKHLMNLRMKFKPRKVETE